MGIDEETVPDEPRRLVYVAGASLRHSEEDQAAFAKRVISARASLVILDNVTDGMRAAGLKPRDETDTGAWYERLAKKLTRGGAAVLLIDHVTKAEADRRNVLPFGSEHKAAGIDGVAFSLTGALKKNTSEVRVVQRKDRLGRVLAQADEFDRVGRLAVTGDWKTGAVTVTLYPPYSSDEKRAEKRQTNEQKRESDVLAYVSKHPGAPTRDVLAEVTGGNNTLTKTIKRLIDEGRLTAQTVGNAKLLHPVSQD